MTAHWKALFPPRSRRKRIAKSLAYSLGIVRHPFHDEQYLALCKGDERRWNKVSMRQMPDPRRSPLFSVIVPVCDPIRNCFSSMLHSVRQQSYQNWELILADASRDPWIRQYISREAQGDPRVRSFRVDNGGISQNTNASVTRAKGEFLVFLDHDDLLSPAALSSVAEAYLAGGSKGDLFYSNEDKISDVGGIRNSPFYKPGWSPHLLLSTNYLNHLIVVRRSLVELVGGLRPEFDGSQDYDLILRILDAKPGILVQHIPDTLYHWRQVEGSTAIDLFAKPEAVARGRKAVMEHLIRRNLRGSCEDYPGSPGSYRVKIEPLENSSVCILTLDGNPLLENLRGSFDRKSFRVSIRSYSGFDDALEDIPSLHPFDYFVFLADGVLPQTGDWLDELVGALRLNDAFSVSPRVLDSSGRIFAMGSRRENGEFVPIFSGCKADAITPRGHANWLANVDCPQPYVLAWKRNALPTVLSALKCYPSSGKEELYAAARRATQHHLVWSHVDFLRNAEPVFAHV